MESVSIVFPAKGKVVLQDEQIRNPDRGELLCEAEKSLISTGTEMYCLQGESDPNTVWDRWITYPFHPGYSMVGKVIAAGEGVTKFTVGDRIAAAAPHCHRFIVRQEDACLVPKNVADDEATWNTLARITQLGVRRAGLQLGETVGVIGLGLLGQLVVQYLYLSGARQIIAIDSSQERVKMALAHGATHGLSTDIRHVYSEILEITDGRLLDVVFDVTGHPDVLAPATQLLRKLGRLVLLGDTPTPARQHLGPRVVGDSISILGIHGSAFPDASTIFNPWTVNEMASLFFDYLMQGRMRVSDLITHRYPPAEAPIVYQRLLHDRSTAMGVIFDWGKV